MSNKLSPKTCKVKQKADKPEKLSLGAFGFRKLGENLSYLQKLIMFEAALIIGCTISTLLAYKHGANTDLLVRFFFILCTLVFLIGLLIYWIKKIRLRKQGDLRWKALKTLKKRK